MVRKNIKPMKIVRKEETALFPTVFGKTLQGIPQPQESHENTAISVIFFFVSAVCKKLMILQLLNKLSGKMSLKNFFQKHGPILLQGAEYCYGLWADETTFKGLYSQHLRSRKSVKHNHGPRAMK